MSFILTQNITHNYVSTEEFWLWHIMKTNVSYDIMFDFQIRG